VEGERQGGVPPHRDSRLGVHHVGAGLHLEHGLGAGAGIGSVEPRVPQRAVLQGGDGPVPHVGIDYVGPRGGERGVAREIGLGAGQQGRALRQLGPDAVHIEVAGLDLPVGRYGNGAGAGGAVADHVGEGLEELLPADGHQLVPVGVGDHPPLLLVDAGVAFVRLETVA